jgi:hypothetical protein
MPGATKKQAIEPHNQPLLTQDRFTGFLHAAGGKQC